MVGSGVQPAAPVFLLPVLFCRRPPIFRGNGAMSAEKQSRGEKRSGRTPYAKYSQQKSRERNYTSRPPVVHQFRTVNGGCGPFREFQRMRRKREQPNCICREKTPEKTGRLSGRLNSIEPQRVYRSFHCISGIELYHILWQHIYAMSYQY